MSTPSPASLSLLSEEEIRKATEYLESTRETLRETIAGLSDSQWHFKPDPERWSVAEILEHITIVEGRVHGIIARMPEAPATAPDHDSEKIEAMILAAVPQRTSRIPAPEILHPVREMTPEQLMSRFEEGRAQTLQLLVEAPCLRGHVAPHPILGLWDGYQWILAGAAHGLRHTEQIREVKALPGF